MAKKGGKRKGAGRPQGSISEGRKLELETLAAFKKRVYARADDLYNAQMDKALGEKYLICLDLETGTASRVEDLETILKFFNGELKDNPDKKFYSITTKSPDSKAIDSLLDRAFGKATQPIDADPELDIDSLINSFSNEYNPDELAEDSE